MDVQTEDNAVRKDERQRHGAHTGESHLASIIASAMDAIISINADQRIIVFNAAAERMFRCPAAEALGAPLGRFIPEHLRGRHTAHVSRFGRTGDTSRSMQVPGTLIALRADGEQFPIEATISQVEVSGEKLFTAIVRDITERKRAEAERESLLQREQVARTSAEAARARLALLAEASGLLAASLDYETALAAVARLAVPLLGNWCVVDLLEKEGAVRRLAVAQAFAAETPGGSRADDKPFAPGLLQDTPRVLQTGKAEIVVDGGGTSAADLPPDAWQLERLRRSGFAAYIAVPLAARGRTLGALSFATLNSNRRYDVEDLALAEELARRAALAVDNARLYQEAQEAVRLREQFLSVASHELRTPLTIIRGYVQGLLRLTRKQPAGAHSVAEPVDTLTISRTRLISNLEKTDQALQRLTTLVADLLDLTRFLKHSSLPLERAYTNLADLVAEMVDDLRHQQSEATPARRTPPTFKFSAEPVWGNWDRARLEQVLANLLDNAIKYSPDGGEIEIGLALEDFPVGRVAGPRAHLTVRDRGIGIPLDQQPRLFQTFARATNAAEGHFPGLGLGLAISRDIVEQHGGRMWVESPGEHQGSTFHVLLPGASAGQA